MTRVTILLIPKKVVDHSKKRGYQPVDSLVVNTIFDDL